MRAGQQPLATLVDAAAVRWQESELASPADRQTILQEITTLFGIGDKDEITYHGQKYLLSVIRRGDGAGLDIEIHEIA